ncbi:T9SS type A sorting domain-containing protein [Brumimicrobium mesophilum]|uniref:T9SS type A sorting domain-containing protein n=1 Tax=Brumimicrobium mesophilum TaxID=392717 RepID=UPI000D142E4C|nr:T9SS type A sorting domain-containing protein [Brumimicrobium mesophilum]
MRQALLFLFALLTLNSGYSQFNRSYGNITTTSYSYFSNFFHISNNNEMLYTNMFISPNNELILTTQEIDDHGEVINFQKNIYVDASFSNDVGYINSISGIFDKGVHRYYVLIIENGSGVKLVWLKTEIESGNLLGIEYSEGLYKVGYMETKLIGGEMVSYLNSGLRLKRIAMSIIDFGSVLIEEVTTHSLTLYDMERGKKMGKLFMLKGKEYFINTQAVNDRNILIYRREGQNQFTKIDLNPNYHFKYTLGTTIFVNGDNDIVITDGEVFNIINSEGNYIKTIDLELGYTFGSDQNFVFYKDNKYYVIYSGKMSGPTALLILDKEFNKLEEREINQVFINRVVEHDQNYYLDGVISNHGKRVVKSDTFIQGYIPYLESFDETLILNKEEYYNSFDFQNCDLNMNIGLGSRAFAMNGISPGITYKNQQRLSRELLDNYVGVDSDNNKFGNTLIYQTGTSELPGPCTNEEDYDEVEEAKYNRSYHLSRQIIADHLDSIQNGTVDYIPVWEIRNWPGNGNTSKGQAKKLADFVDFNKNGVYEPMEGDYPIIYGDECVFSISHYWDEGNQNRKLEFHSYIYHFDCDSTSTFRNVLFRKLNVISRGADLNEFYMGVYQEGDIGQYNNDYIGTNPDLGMTYFYNGTLSDYSNYGVGFNDRLAATGTMILKGFKNEDNGIDDDFGVEENESINGLGFGDGIIDNEYSGLAYSVPYYRLVGSGSNADLATPTDLSGDENFEGWINNAKGLTAAGNPITYGGLGFGGSVPTKYVFPWQHDTFQFGTSGNQPPFENWSEMDIDGSGTANEEGDRKMFSSFGETSISQGDMITLDYAYLFTRDEANSTAITSPLQSLFEKGDSIRNAFLSNNISCGKNFDGLIVEIPKKNPFITGQINIFPNPSSGQYKITGIGKANTITVYGLNGAKVKDITNYKIGEIIDLQNVRGGIYFFHIVDQYQNEVKKVIKK